MTWTVKLSSNNPAVVNATNSANIDVTFLASHTDGRTKSLTVPSATWSVAKATAYAEDFVAQLNTADTQQAASTSKLPGINSYIATNPTLASG